MRRRSEAAAVVPEGETGDAIPAARIQEMLQDLLIGLPEPDRRLIESLFWDPLLSEPR